MKPIKTVHTPEGPLLIVGEIAEILHREGVISGDLNGRLHAADAATVKAATILHGVCDFCGTPAPGAKQYLVPDFELPHTDATSVDGWAACETCVAMIDGGRAKDLLNRAAELLSFGKFTKKAIAELHAKFWKGLGEMREANDVLQVCADFIEHGARNDEGLKRTQPTTQEGRAALIGQMLKIPVSRIEAACRSGEADPETLKALVTMLPKHKSASSLQEILTQLGAPHKPLPYQVPHWQRALDARFEAAETLRRLIGMAGAETYTQSDLEDPAARRDLLERVARMREVRKLGFDLDLKALRTAATYSFNVETIAAIRQAAQSIPHDAPLTSVEAPNTGAGWFWFAEPIVGSSGAPLATDKACALLWAWSGGEVSAIEEQYNKPEGGELVAHITRYKPAIRFSIYIIPEGGVAKGAVVPSTRWYWPLDLSFHDMLAYNRENHRLNYGEGGKKLVEGVSLASEDETMAAIADMSLFFMMACLWFRQTVPGQPKKKITPTLTREEGHIERHARKRYQREHDLPEPPTVQVIALRKAARSTEPSILTGGHHPREYHFRFGVIGHARLQACGPGRKDRKLIWINAFVKGPEGKPFRAKERVYAVIR